MTTPVNFEIAKLLKEKGYKTGSEKGYLPNGELGISQYSALCYNDEEDYPTKYAAPTISEVVMWIYEKHGIWITVDPIKWSYEDNIVKLKYITFKLSLNKSTNIEGSNYSYNSPTEAYEAAIEYSLKNLIK